MESLHSRFSLLSFLSETAVLLKDPRPLHQPWPCSYTDSVFFLLWASFCWCEKYLDYTTVSTLLTVRRELEEFITYQFFNSAFISVQSSCMTLFNELTSFYDWVRHIKYERILWFLRWQHRFCLSFTTWCVFNNDEVLLICLQWATRFRAPVWLYLNAVSAIQVKERPTQNQEQVSKGKKGLFQTCKKQTKDTGKGPGNFITKLSDWQVKKKNKKNKFSLTGTK